MSLNRSRFHLSPSRPRRASWFANELAASWIVDSPTVSVISADQLINPTRANPVERERERDVALLARPISNQTHWPANEGRPKGFKKVGAKRDDETTSEGQWDEIYGSSASPNLANSAAAVGQVEPSRASEPKQTLSRRQLNKSAARRTSCLSRASGRLSSDELQRKRDIRRTWGLEQTSLIAPANKTAICINRGAREWPDKQTAAASCQNIWA